MRKQVRAIVRLHLELKAKDDSSTEILTLLQDLSDYLIEPVEIIDLEESDPSDDEQ